jgi:hypothetical protein
MGMGSPVHEDNARGSSWQMHSKAATSQHQEQKVDLQTLAPVPRVDYSKFNGSAQSGFNIGPEDRFRASPFGQ